MKFRSQADLDFVVDKGPWSVDNSLVVVDRLQPNMALQAMRVAALPVWVQFWGLPLEYHVQDVAKDLGNVVGTTMLSSEGAAQFSSHLNFIRVKVQIDPRIPLVQNVRIRLDNGVARTIECKYERVFRSCASCHVIGHLVNTCPSTVAQKEEGFDQIAHRTFQRFGTKFLCSFTSRAAKLTWQEWIRDRRTRGFTRI